MCLLTLLAGCNEQIETAKRMMAAPASGTETLAREATADEDQWEYLVVSFGKTSFNSIEESIIKGGSKLVAFQEFADLLSGHEGIDLQTKLDILGRFGWELVDTLGSIAGDQQLFLKRSRLENRIDIEREALKTLSVILREESEKREKRLKEYLAELDRLREKRDTEPQEGLVELDSIEKRDRERDAERKATAAITSMFPEPPNSYQANTQIKSVDVRVSADENDSGKILYKGTITIAVDATEELLIETNKYRASQAKKLLGNFKRGLYKATPLSIGGLTDFDLKVNIQITHAGNVTTVASSSDSVRVKGYKGYWGYN